MPDVYVGSGVYYIVVESYYGDELFRSLRNHRVSKGCEDCSFARKCRGGLRCLSYALTGDPFTADPGCWRRLDAAGD